VCGSRKLFFVPLTNSLTHTHTHTNPQIKLCKHMGFGKYVCMDPLSIMSIGLPGTRKTLLFNGYGVTIRLNNQLKSISMYGHFDEFCPRDFCGDASRNRGSWGRNGVITYIPTTKVLNEILPVEPTIVHRLNVTSVETTSGKPLMIGPDNQAVYTYTNKNPAVSSFYTLGDASSVLQPTKTEVLKPAVGCAESSPCTYYSKPFVYDGTQYWLYYGYGGPLVSSLDYSTSWTLLSGGSDITNGAAAASNVLWFKDSNQDARTFSLYDIC
jgi:hypothetical protein